MFRSLFALGMLSFALTFCGLQERLSSIGGSSGGSGSNSAPTAPSSGSSAETPPVEKANLSAAQRSIIDGGTAAEWADQGISWTVPDRWKKMKIEKESFNYQSPDNAFLLVNISVLPDSFPADVSLRAYHDQALQQLKNGKYESVKLVEIDGITGVEFVESPPSDKTDSRRHQWIGYRDYLGQKQQLNVMLATRGTNFEKHTDDFQAIIYSAKFTK